MLGRVGLALEAPDTLLVTNPVFTTAKTEYTTAYQHHGAATLQTAIEQASEEGPVQIVRTAIDTIDEVQIAEVQARQTIYTMHDFSIPEDTELMGSLRTIYDRNRDRTRWRQTLRENAGFTARPSLLIPVARNYLVKTTLALLDSEEAQLRTRVRSRLRSTER